MEDHPKSSGPTLRERLLALVAVKYQHKAQAVKNPAKLPQARLQANRREAQAVEPPETVGVSDGVVYGAELRGMTDKAFCFSQKWQTQQGRAHRDGAHADILEFERRLISRCRKLGVPLFGHCVNRGAVEQNSLFVRGLSKARYGQSPHNYGLAVDIVHGTKAWDLTRRQWSIIGHIGKEVAAQLGIKVEWGGDWSFYDPAHWELADWREIRAGMADPANS